MLSLSLIDNDLFYEPLQTVCLSGRRNHDLNCPSEYIINNLGHEVLPRISYLATAKEQADRLHLLESQELQDAPFRARPRGWPCLSR